MSHMTQKIMYSFKLKKFCFLAVKANILDRWMEIEQTYMYVSFRPCTKEIHILRKIVKYMYLSLFFKMNSRICPRKCQRQTQPNVKHWQNWMRYIVMRSIKR